LLRGRLTGGDAAAILAWAELSEAVRWWKWVVVRWNGVEWRRAAATKKSWSTWRVRYGESMRGGGKGLS
jgi:hypothetical protein